MGFFTKEKSLYRLVDNANVLLLYFDAHGKVSVCNKKIEEITGKLKENIIGKHWTDVLSRNDNNSAVKQQMLKAIIGDSIKYKRPNNFDGLITDKDNHERFISWSISPILARPEALEGILLIGNDITELKEGEASLKRIDETLKNIFSNIKEYALYVINLDGNITYYGMGSEMMFGWQKNEIIFKQVSILHPEGDALPKLAVILEEAGRSGQYEAELELVKKDGSLFPVILTVSKFLDTENKLIGYVFIAKDITERKKLEYEILQSEKLAAIGQLAAGMAHEINNPLFVISGRSEMALGQEGLTPDLKEALSIIYAQADRIRKLVDQLLKFSRKTPPKSEVININDTIEAVLPLLSYHKLPAARVDIEKDLAKEPLFIKGDANQLQEVFLNLCLNAHQSMPEGGRLNIKTSSLYKRFVEIKISDTGQGIPQENLKNIFMPFFSTKKEGTGLGLSICYNIIKNHNGTIEVESQVNHGTTFAIKLPAV